MSVFWRILRHGLLVLVCGTVPAVGQSLPASGQPTASPTTAAHGIVRQAGVQGPLRRLSMDEAVQLALEQNLGVQASRLEPQIQDYTVAQARTAWTPQFSTTFRTTSQDNPPNSFLSGGQNKVSDDQLGTTIGVQQQLLWGGRYSASWDSSRATTTNIFTNFDPVVRSNVSFSYVQPLVRNFRVDGARQQLQVSRNGRDLADVQLRQTIVTTTRNVKNAYWDLVFARASLDVQQQSLDLARQSLRDNRTRVEVGTMAPIDIVEAEAEVARNEEAVILAQEAIERTEDQLRALIFDPAMPDFWNVRIEPSDQPVLQPQPVDFQAAIPAALERRTDLRQVRKNLETTEVNIRFFQNQTLPDVNLQLDYGLSGLGGSQLIREAGFPGPIIGRSERGFGSVLSDIFSNDFPSWTLGVVVGYPIGTSGAEASLARARLQYNQGQTDLRALELQVATQLRDLGRQVTTNLQRVQATSASRQLAERRLEAEQKKFGVGMSTSFLVFQAQRDLAAARNNELRATLDYHRAVINYEAAQEAPPTGGAVGQTGGVTTGQQGTGSAVMGLTTGGQGQP